MTPDLLIVAAGIGSRLKAKGDLKPLVKVNEIPLITRSLHTAFQVGIKRAVIVTGYNAPILEDYLQSLATDNGWNIETVYNPRYSEQNGLSVTCARDLLGEEFFLTMCDHLVEPEIYEKLAAYPLHAGEVALAIDRKLSNPMVDIEDVTKVMMSDDHIVSIGKSLEAYNAFDTGVFRATDALFDAILDGGNDTGDYGISSGLTRLAEHRKAIGVDIGDLDWIDVDAPEMLEIAERWLAEHHQ